MLSVDCRLGNNLLCIIVEVLLCAFIYAKYQRKVTRFQPPMRLYNVCLYFEIVLQGNLELIEFDCQISPVRDTIEKFVRISFTQAEDAHNDSLLPLGYVHIMFSIHWSSISLWSRVSKHFINKS